MDKSLIVPSSRDNKGKRLAAILSHEDGLPSNGGRAVSFSKKIDGEIGRRGDRGNFRQIVVILTKFIKQ